MTIQLIEPTVHINEAEGLLIRFILNNHTATIEHNHSDGFNDTYLSWVDLDGTKRSMSGSMQEITRKLTELLSVIPRAERPPEK